MAFVIFQTPLSIIGDNGESNDQLDGLSKSAYERRIQRLEDEKKELLRKLADSNRALQVGIFFLLANDQTKKFGFCWIFNFDFLSR